MLLSATPMEAPTTEPIVTAAMVTTDKVDYAPGETALITTSNTDADGLKFGDGEMVQFQVTRTDGIEDAPMGNLPWYVTDGVGGFDAYQDTIVDSNNDGVAESGDRNADGIADWMRPDTDGMVNGSIRTEWLVEDQYLGSSLLLTVTGQYAGAVATTEFTDAAGGTWSISDVTVSEGNAGTTNFVFAVTFVRTANGTANVDWATAPGTTNPATAGTDYTAASGTITFNGNTSGTQTVTVVVNGDTTVEPNETFFVNLSNPTTGTTISDSQGIGTIVNDDVAAVTPTVTLTAANATYTGSAYAGSNLTTTVLNGATDVSGFGTLSYVYYASNGTTVIAAPTNVGSYFAKAVFTSNNAAYNNAESTLDAFEITKATAAVVVAPYSVIYDGQTHTAAVSSITGVNGETGATVGTVDVSNTTHTNAGTYSTDSWSFTGTANYNNIASTTITDVITPRAALVNYIGQTTWMTSGTSSTTAQVTLTASMQDATGTALVGATVDFIDTSTGKTLASGVKVSPVTGSPGAGTANTVVTLSTGQYGSQEYVILVRLTGNYDNTAQAGSDKTATVVVSKLAATSEIIAAGTIANLNTAATTDGMAGTYGATADGLTSYSVGLKYNKSGANPQGKISLTIEQSDGSTIYIKSNSISSINVTGTTNNKDATVYTKATIYRIDSSGIMTTLDGNVTLRLDIHDGGAAGDKIGFTVLSTKNSTLYYSNDWFFDGTVWKTKLQAVATGGTQVC